MRELKNDTLISITDNAYVGLIVHLALAIERIKQGEKIEMDANFLKQLKLGTRIRYSTENYYPISFSFRY